MKAVILLAGLGQRMKGKYDHTHKSLISLNNEPMLSYLLRNLKLAGIDVVVPVVGYQANEILDCISKYKDGLELHVVYNNEYRYTNNLVSLLCAENEIRGRDFVLCNGDMVFDYRILSKIIEDHGSRIAVDNLHKNEFIDSPRVRTDGKLIDLGRHIDLKNSDGYAIGIYRFSGDLADDFFKVGHEYVEESRKYGFHDPLRDLFANHNIYPTYVDDMLWTDVDEEADIVLAEEYIRRLINDYR